MMTTGQALMCKVSAVGIANIATPTPNHPIWVKEISAEGRKEPMRPKVRRDMRSKLRPVFAPM